MPELENVESVKQAGFVDPSSSRAKRKARIKQEEEELAKLMSGEDNEEDKPDDTETVETKTEETPKEEDQPLTAEERSFKKRYGDLRRHAQKEREDLEKKVEALESRLNNTTSIIPPKSDEDINQWAKKYPDVAGIIETIATKKAQEMSSGLDARLKALDEQAEEVSRSKAEARIRKAHPDFDTLRSEDAFHDWADKQPKWVQDALYENADDPDSVVRVIDLYKMDNGLTVSAKKAKAKEAASQVSRTERTTIEGDEGKPIFKESDIQKKSDSWFEKNYDAIREAQLEGRFVYDVTAGAR